MLRAQTQPALPLPPPSPAPTATIPDLPDETQIAVFDDGTKFTMGDFKKIYGALPPENQKMALRDRKTFLEQWGLMRKLAQQAEAQKLDQESPTKELLQYDRMNIMSSAQINNVLKTAVVEPPEIVQYYGENKEKYKLVKVKAIYISFSEDSPANSKGKKLLTEGQAKAKAVRLLSEIRGGADFVKLAKENSDDETSRAKGGDLFTLSPKDNVPEAFRTAVFALKKGEVSEPLRQQNGYYLLLADDVTYRPLSQVRDEIFTELKQQKFAQWMEKTRRETKVVLTSPEFLGLAPLVPGK